MYFNFVFGVQDNVINGMIILSVHYRRTLMSMFFLDKAVLCMVLLSEYLSLKFLCSCYSAKQIREAKHRCRIGATKLLSRLFAVSTRTEVYNLPAGNRTVS